MSLRSFLLLFTIVFLTGCTIATMQLDPQLASSTEPLLVSGHNPRIWNRPLSFGAFRTEQVSEGGEWTWSTRILGADVGVSWQRYRLLLTDGTDRVQTECKRRKVFIAKDGLEIDPSAGHLPVLQCAFRPESGGDVWALTLKQSGPRFAGTFSSDTGESSYVVTSAHRAEGGLFDSAAPLGYVFENDGMTTAAVESANKGRVWIASGDQSERLRNAAAAAALLLFDPEV